MKMARQATRSCLMITAHPHLFTNTALAKAMESRGCQVNVMHPETMASHPPKGLSKNTHSLVLMRAGLLDLRSSLKAASRLCDKGLHVVNTPQGIDVAKDKWRTHLTLVSQGLPQVPTLKLDSPEELALAWGTLAPPWVIKSLYGSQGKGVHLAPTLAIAQRVAKTYMKRGYSVLIQPKLKVKRDLRLLVVAGQVLAAVRRHPAKGDFRSNWHQGGQLQLIKATSREKKLAIEAANGLNLEFAGIDILETQDGHLHILEANDSPGLQGLSRVFKGDIFDEVAKALLKSPR
ncbi:MAG: RimK family alpha-L-glutamate ligase [Planctomycetota bacterium]